MFDIHFWFKVNVKFTEYRIRKPNMHADNKTSILCPNCRKLVSSDETKCPYCGTPRPGSWIRNNPITQMMNDSDSLIKAIIYLNAGMFIISILLSPGGLNFSGNPLTLLSPGSQGLLIFGATGTIPIDRMHRWWTLLSANTFMVEFCTSFSTC